MSSNRLYVITRSDLSKSQQAVQAGHAVAEWVLKFPETWQNEYLIYLRVRSEKEIQEWIKKMREEKQLYVVFREPDLQYQTTAIATISDGKDFNHLPLLR